MTEWWWDMVAQFLARLERRRAEDEAALALMPPLDLRPEWAGYDVMLPPPAEDDGETE